ncbi:MAG: hypothetical protein CO102_01960 [Candidatus Brennerbacteria bacterium CG_4_9_14_3_um_filter_43_9]|uniref:Uncharacterized protein n=1 Tax=Candidatus Brennerbacteria bacterium CG_4_9_14_3_um_filter_43_9 TaxID=1974522 RepID=A0A2M8C1Z9_9BACT|nr:MAG: hypothetical protein CO102_01960 [Candidatus Brennerbacteria bacterium CG_4_9_14_3_um_filter_43_9]
MTKSEPILNEIDRLPCRRRGRNSAGNCGGRAKIPSPDPLPFCPPALWRSLSRLLKMGGAKNFSEDDGL